MISAIVFPMACLLGGDEASTNLTGHMKLAWHTTYSEALAEAKRVDKPLFVLFSAGSSPAVRRVGNRPALSDDIENALDAGYVRMYVDTETESGRILADEFEISKVPAIVLLERGSDRLAHRSSGTPTTAQLLSMLTRYATTNPAGRQIPTNELARSGSAGTLQASGNVQSLPRTDTQYSATPAIFPASSAFLCRT